MRSNEQKVAVPNEVQRAIKEILEERLRSYGLRNVDVRAGFDHEDDEALFVNAYFDLTDTAVEPSKFYDLTTVLRENLEAHREFRFPHLRYHFHEKQKVAGWR